jgi:cyclopropane fatty-acyl-phospholipid synthase-like methyltransferase
VLRACRRLLRPGGRLAFFTIEVTPGLPPDLHRRALAAGPPTPAGPDIAGLLQRARFVDVVAEDRTQDYLDTARAWLAARLRHRNEMRPLDPVTFDNRIADGQATIPAIEAGLLCRRLYVARRD